jgi:hypothetical protein
MDCSGSSKKDMKESVTSANDHRMRHVCAIKRKVEKYVCSKRDNNERN